MVVAAVEAINVLQAEVISRPGVQIVRRGKTCQVGLVHRDLNVERDENAAANLIAHRVHIVNPSRKAVSPDDTAVERVHELYDDEEAAVRDLDRT